MFLKLYAIALPVFFAIDMVWLGLISRTFYTKYLGFLMKPDVNWIAGITFYLLFIVGLVFFVIAPSIEKHSLMYGILAGALFGLISYATYDLTNLATIRNWPMIVTVVDMAWGTVLAASVSTITVLLAEKLGVN